MNPKELLAALAIVLTLVAFAPYFHDLYRNRVQPHVLYGAQA